MSKKVQRQYSAELKASAVKMVIEELKTLSQVSQDLDIPLQTLHSWGSYHIAAKSAICGSSSHVNLTNTIKPTSYDFLLLANTR